MGPGSLPDLELAENTLLSSLRATVALHSNSAYAAYTLWQAQIQVLFTLKRHKAPIPTSRDADSQLLTGNLQDTVTLAALVIITVPTSKGYLKVRVREQQKWPGHGEWRPGLVASLLAVYGGWPLPLHGPASRWVMLCFYSELSPA